MKALTLRASARWAATPAQSRAEQPQFVAAGGLADDEALGVERGGEAFEGVGLARQSGQTVARYVIDDDLLFSDIASDDAGKGGDGLGHRGYPFRELSIVCGLTLTRRPSQLIKRRKLRRGDQDDDGREPDGRTVRQSARRPGRPPGPRIPHGTKNDSRPVRRPHIANDVRTRGCRP